MGKRPFRIQFEYFDGRKPYRYALEPTDTVSAIDQYIKIRDRLKTSNENGVSRLTLKIGNRIILRDKSTAYPSRWYVVKEKDDNFFATEGRPWGVCVPNSSRRKGNFATQETAQAEATERNRTMGVDKLPNI